MADLHFHAGQRATDRTEGDGARRIVAGHGGASLRQSVAGNHAETGSVHEAFDLGRNGRAGHGEEMGAIQAERFAQQAQERAIVGGIFQTQG